MTRARAKQLQSLLTSQISAIEVSMRLKACKLNENGSNMFVLFSNKAWVMICEFLRVWVCYQPKDQFEPEFSPLYFIK